MLDQIAKSLKAHFDAALVDELLAAYQDAKHNFYLRPVGIHREFITAAVRWIMAAKL